MTDAEKSDSFNQQDNWDLPSSSVSSGQLTDDPTKPYRKKYRSKSAVSNDPRSPYYTSQGLASEESMKLGGRFTKSQSVSCVPGYDCQTYANKCQLPFNGGIVGLNLSPDDPKAATIRQHYYPEGGWGYVVCVCAFLVEVISGGIQASFGLLLITIMSTFSKEATLINTVLVGVSCMSVSLLLTPVVVSLGRRKSPRLLAILGGLVCALGCLFTSFASQLHQLHFSCGVVLGAGLGLTRSTATLMVGQYFKKRRELVEVFVVCGSGTGTALVPLLVAHAISTLGWRLGLQAITGLVSLTFLLGIFYRPASLYHPQRRAILHLKGLQKRSKAKDKGAQKEKPPFFDLTVLRSRTVQILIAGSAFSAVGIHVPFFLLMYQGHEEGLPSGSLLRLQAYMGLASVVGSAAFGFIVVKNSLQCFIARQYLSQASLFMMAGSLLAFVSLQGYSGFVLFTLVYGFFHGGYMYTLKMFVFEKVRARNFARAWGFVLGSQAIPLLIGVPLTGYLTKTRGERMGLYFACACIFMGGLLLFFIDLHKRNVKRQKSNAIGSGSDIEQVDRRAYLSRRVTLQELANSRILAKHKISNELLHKQELTCISEEVIMENIFDDYVDDCITSCNKEEKYLMLSEFENNLINTQESSSVSQEVRKLAQERKISSSSPPLLEHCPNCFRVVPIEGTTTCGFSDDLTDVPTKTHVSRSSAKKLTASRKKENKNSLQNDIIDEVTSSM
ncbi:monocarboxylate transporter 12-like [Argiope bruennichi]|uniref:monocarboxylate transporter 12-like n=1 Tax=Argiope bruennichi TaxID=94029 RepID=UPI0024953569|nr:monocarboxylate transporter 12-like [Argiope bruennichi]